MAKGPWLRHSLTNLPSGADVDMCEAHRLGCNLYHVASIAPYFGVTKTRYFRDVVIPQARALGVHFVDLRDVDGKVLGYATRNNSAEWGADKIWKPHKAGRLDGTITDVSGGAAATGASASAIEAIVARDQK